MTNHPPPPLQFLDNPRNPHPHPPAVEVALVQKRAGAHAGRANSTAAGYLCDRLTDAMVEFDGRPVGR